MPVDLPFWRISNSPLPTSHISKQSNIESARMRMPIGLTVKQATSLPTSTLVEPVTSVPSSSTARKSEPQVENDRISLPARVKTKV